MATQTPVKEKEINCFVCYSNSIRPIRLSGRKSKKDGFSEKLNFVLKDDKFFDLANCDPSVCRNCYRKIEQTYDFMIQLKISAERYQSGSCVRVKRCMVSPITPKSRSSFHDILPQISKSRKQLKLQSTFETPVEAEKENHPVYEMSGSSKKTQEDLQSSFVSLDGNEHSYSTPSHEPTRTVIDQAPLMLELRRIFKEGVSTEYIQELRAQCFSLTSRTASFCSVLYKYRDMSRLEDNADHFLDEIIEEMIQRVPILLTVMLCVATPANENVKPSIIPVLASAYSILLKHRYDNLSAFHRLTTVIAIRGGLDERFVAVTLFFPSNMMANKNKHHAQTRLNKLGLMLSWSTRVTLQESIHTMSEKLIADKLKKNPLVKVTGDNLDIYVKTSHLSKERRHKDLHLFASNIIFSRVATTDMSNVVPKVDVGQLNYEKIIMPEDSPEKAKLLHAYSVLLARVLCHLPAFQQYKKLVPNHIPHEFSEKMSRKSAVYPLPIMFQNETKHEDCMAIMDSYEELLSSHFNLAFGNTDLLRKYAVPLGGDQLTRVRLQGAKNLRTLSITPERRYDDLHPIVCEMWHVKQDLLEKCYKKLFKAQYSPGTLSHFKTILHRTDVNGKVKGRFQAHFDLLMSVGEGMVIEQFLEYFKMESMESQPQHQITDDLQDKSPDEQIYILMNVVQEFMAHYGYGRVDSPRKLEKKSSAAKIICISKSGISQQKVVIKCSNVPKPDPDELFNYAMQLCHWYLHLSELHDTAKEGDLNRTVLNCQYSLPFFYSHSKLSKYLVENVDYILKCKFFLSPLQKIRVLEGSFVNTKGGKGHNVESDLAQEHSVCNQKTLIKSLVANKSEKSIKRVTGAADTIAEICTKFDDNVHIKLKSGHHTKPLNESDQSLIAKALRKIRPFNFTPGRKCPGFTNINSIPVSVEQFPFMWARLNQIIDRLTRGLNVVVDEDEDVDNI